MRLLIPILALAVALCKIPAHESSYFDMLVKDFSWERAARETLAVHDKVLEEVCPKR